MKIFNRMISHLGMEIPDQGTKTAVSGAATLDKRFGIITSESLSTSAGATYTLTLTNKFIKATSQVLVSIGTASAGTPTLCTVTPAAGSVVIVVQNIHSTNAFNAALKFFYQVINK